MYRVYIKATPERIWEAITDPEWNGRYGYAARPTTTCGPAAAYRSFATEEMKQARRRWAGSMPEVIVDGEVLEADPPRRLVQTWRMLMDPTAAAEGFSRLTWEIEGRVRRLLPADRHPRADRCRASTP